MSAKQNRVHQRLMYAAALCDSLSPHRVLARGYSVIRKDGAVLKSSTGVCRGDRIEVQLCSGRLDCMVDTVAEKETP